MFPSHVRIVTGALLTCLTLTGTAFTQDTPDPLAAGFHDPPQAARPRTWWHWIGNNVTKEGITKDLEWMQRAGIAGMQLADVSAGGGQDVNHPVEFGTPAWLAAVRHAAAEADRLGLEMGIFSSPGWSETGGPWVTPKQAMKRLVWTKTTVTGPRAFQDVLPQAPANLDFYADSAVVALPLPADESEVADLRPVVTSSGGTVDANALFDGSLRSGMTVTVPEQAEAAWVQLEFARPFAARAITLGARAGRRAGVPVGRVLAGDSPNELQPLLSLPGPQLYRQGSARTFAFPQTTARFWRIEMTGAPLDPARTMSQDPPQAVDRYFLAEMKLYTGARVHHWEEKTGSNQFLFEYETVPTPRVPDDAAVDRARVVDLTDKMDAQGTLTWDVPAGRWAILRMGYVPTGARNRPATGAGSGLEADKLSRPYMEAYVHGYLDPIAEALGPLFGKSLRYVVMDSWEAGMQNWTDEMIGEFRRRRGYDPTPYLPVLTGYVEQSADVSDRFLWDFRRTLADMWADYHYGTLTDMLHRHGMGTYAEAAGVSLEIPEDTLLNKSRVDIPMGEFWLGKMHPPLMYYQDVRGAASAAHAYGKPLVAAESFTGGGYESPFTMKKAGDYWLAQGINRMVFHTSAHQPLDTKPGNTMVGTHINRNITWAELALPFTTYLARNCYLLQQGRFVADLAYLLNEGAPSTMPIWGAGLRPKPPAGYDFDYINADVLLNRMSVADDGRLVLPGGMSYRMLVLPQTRRLRPALLEKIRDLVRGGAVVVGPRPLQSPSLAHYPDADRQVQARAAELWADLDGVSRTIHRYGKGMVVWGLPLTDILDIQGIARDFDYGDGLDADLAWLHRRAGDVDLYYVANLTDQARAIEARFRVSGRAAELWHADTGKREPAAYHMAANRTTVPLHLDQHESVFVVFRHSTDATSRTRPPVTRTPLVTVPGPWDVSFPPDLGAPDHLRMAELASWTDSPDKGVKYFSGTATYTKTLSASQSWFQSGTRLVLDLGAVGDLAEVSVNGENAGILWKPPYQADVTALLKPGANELTIKVTNEWTNRLTGDRSVPADQQVLDAGSTRGFFFGRPSRLSPSGLMGPVTLFRTIDGPLRKEK